VQQIILGTDDVSVTIRIVDSTAFTPEEGVTSATAGLALWYKKGATGAETALDIADLANDEAAHTDGDIAHINDGYYRVDLPDAAIPTAENEVTVVGGTVTGMIVLGTALIGVQPIGAPAGASIAADLATIEGQTDDIGAAGAGLSAVPWNGAWDPEVQSEVEDAIVAYNLDHLCKTATDAADMTTEVADNTILSRVLAAGDTSAFDPATDGLQPTRDHIGNGTNLTEAGGTGDHLTGLVADATKINGSAAAAARLALSAAQIIPGTVDSTEFPPTATEFESDDITESTADHYNGRLVVFTSGDLAGQVTDVTDYAIASGRGHFTVTALTEAPADDATFVLV
jgi:hypothetical protein